MLVHKFHHFRTPQHRTRFYKETVVKTRNVQEQHRKTECFRLTKTRILRPWLFLFDRKRCLSGDSRWTACAAAKANVGDGYWPTAGARGRCKRAAWHNSRLWTARSAYPRRYINLSRVFAELHKICYARKKFSEKLSPAESVTPFQAKRSCVVSPSFSAVAKLSFAYSTAGSTANNAHSTRNSYIFWQWLMSYTIKEYVQETVSVLKLEVEENWECQIERMSMLY